MKRLLDTLLKWKLEIRRYFNDGLLRPDEWSVLLELRTNN